MQGIQQNIVLFDFYFRKLGLLNSLPEDVRDPDVIVSKLAKDEESFEVSAPLSTVQQYNESFTKITEQFRDIPQQKFKTLIILFVIIRISCVISAFFGYPILTLLLSLLQFIFMPASFFISTAGLVLLSPAMFAAHYVTIVPLQILVNSFLPEFLQFYLEISNEFIIFFFIFDQIACIACYFETPVGRSKPFGTKLWIHIIWGFFNCKTYSLILLFLLRGYKINLTLWLIDYCFGLTNKLAILLSRHVSHWAILFYHQHRMAHIPRVYEQAHKFHHYLHDTTSFDAHIYGSGAPEEWLCLFVEIVFCLLFGILPVSLSSQALMLSWSNKIGHTRKDITSGGVNHHADHHTYHRKNFGIYNAVIDMLFETNTNNDTYGYGNYSITKTIKDSTVHFTFKKEQNFELSQEDMKDYYNPSFYSYFKRLIGRFSSK